MRKFLIALLLVPTLASASEIRDFWTNKSYYESGKRAGCMSVRQCISSYRDVSERNACIAGSVQCFEEQNKVDSPSGDRLHDAYNAAWGKR